MAIITGSFAGNNRNLQPYINYTYTQDIVNNSTTIKAKLYVKKLTSYGQTYNASTPYSLSIAGSTVAKGNRSMDMRRVSVGESAIVASGEKTIKHEEDGSVKVKLYGLVDFSGSTPGKGTVSKTVSFPSIARATIATIEGSKIFGQSVTIYHQGSSSNFTHTLKYSMGSESGTIVEKTSGTSTVWTIPLSLQNQIPNSDSGIITITCITYNDNTEIGKTDTEFEATLSSSSVQPDIYGVSYSEGSTKPPSLSGYYQNISRIKCVINAQGSYGSSITNYKIKIGSMPELSSTSNTIISATITTSGYLDVTVTVTDSRGNTATRTFYQAIEIKAYTKPVIETFSCKRTMINELGEEEQSNMGNIGYITTTGTISSSMYNRKRILKYKATTSSYWETITLNDQDYYDYKFSSNLDKNTAYDLKIIYQDDLTSVERDILLSNIFPLVSLNAKGNGIAFGKDSVKENVFEVSMDAVFDKSIKINGGIDLNTESFGAHTSYLDTPTSVTIVGNYELSDEYYPTTSGTLLSVKNNHYKQFQIYSGHMNSVNLFYRTGHSENTGGTAPGFSPWARIYTTLSKPTPPEIGALSLTGGTITGTLNVLENINTGRSINIGQYEEDFRSVNLKRRVDSIDFEARFGVTSSKSFVLKSTDSPRLGWGAVIEAYDGALGKADKRYVFTNLGVMPMTDNAVFLGCSSNRWEALYCTSGTIYTASPKSAMTYSESLQSKDSKVKNTILKGIKNAKLYPFVKSDNNGNSEKVNLNETSQEIIVGFDGDELKEKNPEFFNLIGSTYTDPITKEQRQDIREVSVIGVLWTGLQEALQEIENLKQEIKEIKTT